MLQQTQTSRVIEPWRRFMASFPTPSACATAPLADVLVAWAGLGFHRRAKFLHQSAQAIVEMFGGEVPRRVEDLLTLPGVGPYTANAIASFAFGEATAVVDTNVGRVLARYVANAAIDARTAQNYAERVVPAKESARFNQALLDVGAQFCARTPRCADCPLRRDCRWYQEGGADPAPGSAGVSKPQSRFEGSDRQLRGRVLAQLRSGETSVLTMRALLEGWDPERSQRVLTSLQSDGLITKERGRWTLGSTSPVKVR